jgi:flagellin
MSIYVNTNAQSVFAQRALSQNTNGLQKNIERLSTGLRINRAADDAAGLSISEKLTSQIRGLEKAEQNIGDGISMLQTMEGGLGVVNENLQRIRELVVQASNGTNSRNELNAIQREINSRVTTINDISDSTQFNGNVLLDGSLGDDDATSDDVNIQSGADQGQTTGIDFDDFIIDVTGDDGQDGLNASSAFDLDDLKVTDNNAASVGPQSGAGTGTSAATSSPLTGLDTMITNIATMRSQIGAQQNSLESKLEYLGVAKENAMSSRSRVLDADISKESSGFVRNQILQQSSAAMLSQANQSPQIALNLLP